MMIAAFSLALTLQGQAASPEVHADRSVTFRLRAPKAAEVLVNGDVRQHGRATDMVFDIPALLSFISGVMTLEIGDLVLTGTPDGVGTLAPGDVVEVEIAGVSRVSNPVTSDA